MASVQTEEIIRGIYNTILPLLHNLKSEDILWSYLEGIKYYIDSFNIVFVAKS